MEYYRKFVLTDSTGSEAISLNDFTDYLAYNPTGLGIYRDSEYISVQTKRIGVNNAQSFRKITFNLYIFGKRSELEVKYAYLRDFVEKHLLKGFRLYYTPQEETRYIECDINVLDKTEKSAGYMSLSLEIYPKSLWLKDSESQTISQHDNTSDELFSFELNEDTDTYAVTFSEIMTDYYAIQFGSGNATEVVLRNDGIIESNTRIRIYGYCVNPILRLYAENSGIVIQYVKFDGITVQQGEYIEIDGNPENAHIELVRTNGTRVNVEQYVDIESNMFLTIPTGNFRLELVDTSNSMTCYATILFQRQYYGG